MRAEGIVSLLAVPIMVDGTVRAVIYGGHRRPTQFGDTVLKGAMRVARDLVERQEHRALCAELREISRQIDNPAQSHASWDSRKAP